MKNHATTHALFLGIFMSIVLLMRTNIVRANCTPTPEDRNPQWAPYYTGPLIDSHLHIPNLADWRWGEEPDDVDIHPYLGKNITMKEINCTLQYEGTRSAFSFFPFYDGQHEDQIALAERIKKKYPKRFVRFMMAAGNDGISPTLKAQRIKTLINRRWDQYQGYGEIGLYSIDGLRDADDWRPDAKIFQRIYPLIRKHKYLVYFHPGENHVDDLEHVLKQNPDINFIVHGEQVENEIGDLMSKYTNIYFTMNDLYGDQYLLNDDNTTESFLEKTEDFGPLLKYDIERWGALIEAHPNQFLWGTDRGGMSLWTLDKAVGERLSDYARAFIARLDSSVQEKFAYKNAQRLINSTQ